LLRAAGPEYFPQNGCVTRVLDLKINGISDVIEKGFEARVTIAFSGLLGSFSEPGQKGQDFIRGDGFQFPVTKFV